MNYFGIKKGLALDCSTMLISSKLNWLSWFYRQKYKLFYAFGSPGTGLVPIPHNIIPDLTFPNLRTLMNVSEKHNILPLTKFAGLFSIFSPDDPEAGSSSTSSMFECTTYVTFTWLLLVAVIILIIIFLFVVWMIKKTDFTGEKAHFYFYLNEHFQIAWTSDLLSCTRHCG